MATTNPRIQVTLEAHQYKSISRFAQVMGKSRSAVVSELVADMLPVLDQLGDVVEMAHALDRESRVAWQGVTGMGKVAPHMRNLEDAREEALQRFHALFAELEADLEDARALREAPPAGGGTRQKAGDACTCTVTKHERMEDPNCPVHRLKRRQTYLKPPSQ